MTIWHRLVMGGIFGAILAAAAPELSDLQFFIIVIAFSIITALIETIVKLESK